MVRKEPSLKCYFSLFHMVTSCQARFVTFVARLGFIRTVCLCCIATTFPYNWDQLKYILLYPQLFTVWRIYLHASSHRCSTLLMLSIADLVTANFISKRVREQNLNCLINDDCRKHISEWKFFEGVHSKSASSQRHLKYQGCFHVYAV